MFRFSQDKRFARVSFGEFMVAATRLTGLAQAYRKGVTAEVLTCEDRDTYNYSTVTFMADEVMEALKQRKSYTPAAFTKEVWERSMKTQVTLRDASSSDSFMICLSVDRHADANRMQFYGQCVGEELAGWIRTAFAQPSFFRSIGDGYSKISDFNFAFGMRVNKIRLSSKW